jgi:hypothetical protein
VRGRLHNNEMQRTAPGKDGAPPLISVFDGRAGARAAEDDVTRMSGA